MFKKVISIAIALVVSCSAYGQFSSDFEADGGGFSPTGDWERGMPAGADGSALGGFGGVEPFGGFSGDNVWGTILGGLHNPDTTSNLQQTFTLATPGTLTFYEWIESGATEFDMAAVFVNGVEEYLSDGDSLSMWREVSIGLPAGIVDIDFQFTTTAVVERVGWYIDDVAISAVPEPSTISLIGFAGLCLIGIHRRN